MADNKYMGKTNKELIIELIRNVETIHNQLKECRPVCFKSENDIIEMKQNTSNFKWVVSTIAILTTAFINILIFFVKKLKGG